MHSCIPVMSSEKFAQRFGRDVEHRAEGAVAETRHLFEGDDEVSDSVLEQRIRTAVGRAVSHPHAVEVNCTGGSVFLGGWVLADEVAELTSAVRAVRGVKELSTFLNTTDHPQHISAFAGRGSAQAFTGISAAELVAYSSGSCRPCRRRADRIWRDSPQADRKDSGRKWRHSAGPLRTEYSAQEHDRR